MLAILNYHNVDTVPAGSALPRHFVSPDRFHRQLWWLRRSGRVGVSLSEGIRRLRAGNAERCVALTFDDGYKDNVVNAAPILREYGFGATCFVVSACIGLHNNWDAEHPQVRRPIMDDTDLGTWLAAGLEIGSHTRTHADLTTLTSEKVMEEMVASRNTLRHLTGAPIRSFCYPYGRSNTLAEVCARRAGYQLAVTTRRGRARPSDDQFALPRLSISGKASIAKFLLKATTPYGDVNRLLAGN